MLFRLCHFVFLVGLLVGAVTARLGAAEIDQPWTRHVIDDSSRGADGTRLADANGDGRLDIVTGWEQGGITRVYLHPGPDKVGERWPAVTVGRAAQVEDAVLVDLDGDGAMDVISCCEGRRQAVLVHWAPSHDDYLDPKQWTTEEIPASINRFRWMFATPMDVNRDGRVDLLAGGKGNGAQLGWFEVPPDPRDLDQWVWHALRPLGWLMSLQASDMDGDGDLDILFTDRKGIRSGCFWLERPIDDAIDSPWTEHLVGGKAREVMFLSQSDLDRDGKQDVIIATRPQAILLCQRIDAKGKRWKEYEIAVPYRFGGSKSAAAADLDGNGNWEIVFSTERASGDKFGVGRIKLNQDVWMHDREFTSISGVDGVKHDLVRLIDLDEDGDLDVLTCEEVRNLGVIWYENPSR